MPSDNPFERIDDPAAEAEQIEEVARLTTELLDQRYPRPARILRGVHPKSHGLLRARLRISRRIPPSLRVGLFADPGRRFRAVVRLSNATVRVEHDLKDGMHGSRGFALKVFDAGRQVLSEDRGRKNQDFLMINQPAFSFANIADYRRLTCILREFNDDLRPFFDPTKCPMAGMNPETIQRTGELIAQVTQTPVANPLEVQYFGAAPFLFGPDRVMKFSVKPRGDDRPQQVSPDASENYLRDAVRQVMARRGKVVFDFLVQVRQAGEAGLDIDNASTVWDEAQTPFQRMGSLRIRAPQRVDSQRRADIDEGLFFTPWHCLPEHQPVGGINRLRKAVYEASAAHRDAISDPGFDLDDDEDDDDEADDDA